MSIDRFDPWHEDDSDVSRDPSCTMLTDPDGSWVRYSDIQPFLSACKQWKQATESRLRLLDSRGEAAKSMLAADRALIEAIDCLSQPPSNPQIPSEGEENDG